MKTYAIVFTILGLTALSSLNLITARAQEGQGQRSANFEPGNNATDDFQPKQSCSCGARQAKNSDEGRIVGGVEADVNEFPWRCNLQVKNNEGKMVFFCGCSVMNSRFILTAAHCTEAVSGRQIYVDLGDHDLSTSSESQSQLVTVKKVNRHPKYSRRTMDNDISILEMSSAVQTSRFSSPVCLPYKFKNEEFSKKTATASGWGTEKEGNRQTPVKLRKVDLPVVTTAECKKTLGNQITNNMICTYQRGKDTCQGDSGGSIDYQDPSSGKYYAIGIVSFGEGCARENKPGVYAKITQYLGFIDQITGGTDLCKD